MKEENEEPGAFAPHDDDDLDLPLREYDEPDVLAQDNFTDENPAPKCCGLCGSTNISDVGHGKFKATVVCGTCDAHWWDRWYTRREWEQWINKAQAEL